MFEFVGREPELRELRSALDRALHGQLGCVFICGEPGIGKTRLADEVGLQALDADSRILWGRCWEAGGAPALWPWVQILRSLVRRDAPALAQHLRKQTGDLAYLLPEIHTLVPGLPQRVQIDAEQARRRLFDAIAATLAFGSALQPLLLVLDDLQGADPLSIRLLGFLLQELASARILIVATYRPLEMRVAPGVAELLEPLQKGRPLLDLRGLDRVQVRNLLERSTGTEHPSVVVEAVHRATGGNPFFVNELIRLMMAEGRFGRPSRNALEDFRLPAHVREIVRERARQLSPAARHLLAVAAVIGKEFRLPVLEQVFRWERPDTEGDSSLALLEEMVASNMVVAQPGSAVGYSFCHALTRQVLYDDLPPARRMHLHRAVGAVMENLYASQIETCVEEIAAHFFHAAASDPEKAIEYCRRAARRGNAVFGYEQAAWHCERGLELLPLLPRPAAPRFRRDLLLDLGEALNLAGQRARAKQIFQDAFAEACGLGDAESIGRAALGYGGGDYSGMIEILDTAGPLAKDDPFIGMIEAALDALGKQQSAVRARLLARLAAELYFRGSLERRDALSREAVEIARGLGDAATLADVLIHRQHAIWSPDNLEERRALAEEAFPLAASIGNLPLQLMARIGLIAALFESGDWTTARLRDVQLAKVIEASRQPAYVWSQRTFEAMQAMMEGRFADAERLIAEAAAIGGGLYRAAAIAQQIQMNAVRRELGRLEELAATEPFVRGMADQFPRVSSLRVELALLYADLRRENEARAQFELLATEDFREFPRDAIWPTTMSELCEVCHFLRDTRRAATLYELLHPYAGRNVLGAFASFSWGSLARSLGVLAKMLGDWSAAERHFELALARNEAFGARPWIARTQLGYAEMLYARSETARAADLASRALSTAEELGMRPLAQQARELLRSRSPANDH